MADKKAPGRPKRTAQKNESSPTGDKPQEDAKVNQNTNEEEEGKNLNLAEEKVVEVTTKSPKGKTLRPSQVRKITHTVYVTKAGRPEQEREMSEQAYSSIVKDPNIETRLPKDSRLVEPNSKGCKDC